MTKERSRSKAVVLVTAGLVLGSVFAGCLSGGGADIKQTGSSTVLPLAQAWAQEYPDASVSVSGGGSSHGRNAILTGDAQIGDASSPMTAGDYEKVDCSVDAAEIEAIREESPPRQYPSCDGVTPTEWVVAWDALTVVVHPDNDWVEGLNYTQLASIFTTQNTAETWAEVPGLEDAPDEPIEIHAPDAASGTYEFFFDEIVGEHGQSLLAVNSDRYHGSANDNVIIQKVSQNRNAVGFFGLAYLLENEGTVEPVPIAEEGTDHVTPSLDNAADYPIVRALYLYTDGIPEQGSLLHGYLSFILSEEGQSIAPEVGYVSQMTFDTDDWESQRDALGASR